VSLRVQLRRDAGKVRPETGPWIRRRQIGHLWGSPHIPAMAEILDDRGHTLGWGLYSPHSEIAVRMLSFGSHPYDQPNENWLEDRIRQALQAREILKLKDQPTTAYREINSEGDGLPGLIVDRYGNDRVVQITTAFMAEHKATIAGYLEHPGRCWITSPVHAAKREGFTPLVDESNPDLRLEFVEHGLRFHVLPPPSQKTGAYLDQRENRHLIARLAAKHGGRLLDVGCFAGGFAIHAAALGVRAIGLDQSEKALQLAAGNARLNNLQDRCDWIVDDMFKPNVAIPGLFGTVIIDPPALSPNKRTTDRAQEAFQRCIRHFSAMVEEHGFLVLCSCSHHFGHEQLERALLGATNRPWTRIYTLGPGPDHPITPGHDQGEYLRVHIYQRRG